MPPVGHTTFGYRSVVSATVQDIYKDRLQVVTLQVPVRILRDAYHDRLIFHEKAGGYRTSGKTPGRQNRELLVIALACF